jgi:hypothetical protein
MAIQNPLQKPQRKVIKLPPMPKYERLLDTENLFQKKWDLMKDEDRKRAEWTLKLLRNQD